MSLSKVATREEWLAARKDLLAKEKDLTRRRDALNIERRNLPMVEIEKDYVFDGPNGAAHLIDMFDDRAQLIVYHFMFDPEWEDGCPSCTAGIDELSPGFFEHLHVRDTSYAMVSRAPLAKLERWKAKKGWDIPRRLLLLPRSHRPGSAGRMGGAEGPQRVRTVGDARLLVLSTVDATMA